MHLLSEIVGFTLDPRLQLQFFFLQIENSFVGQLNLEMQSVLQINYLGDENIDAHSLLFHFHLVQNPFSDVLREIFIPLSMCFTFIFLKEKKNLQFFHSKILEFPLRSNCSCHLGKNQILIRERSFSPPEAFSLNNYFEEFRKRTLRAFVNCFKLNIYFQN